MCRLLTLEDNLDSPVTKMKYFLEPAANAQKRFDRYKERWDLFMEDICPELRGRYYIVCDCSIMQFPPEPPIWFYAGYLRPDQIGFLEKCAELYEERKKKKSNAFA